MKRHILIFLVVLILSGCTAGATETSPAEPTQQEMTAGFFTEGMQTFYRTESGDLHIGWLELNDTRYYLDDTGVLQIGWLELDGKTYYLNDDGAMCRGQVEIDGNNHYFSSGGEEILMANPWSFLPEGYMPELADAENGYQVDRRCIDALMQMLNDCRASGYNAQIASAYRSHEHQTRLYNRKVQYYIDLGYSRSDAERKAGTVVAVPGTSEHELGLAVDLVDGGYWVLDEAQEKTAAQKWLMTHCWEYGFILRYPNGKSESTGIIYEPWHYRYVGKEIAAELQETGMCLEEYFQSLR